MDDAQVQKPAPFLSGKKGARTKESFARKSGAGFMDDAQVQKPAPFFISQRTGGKNMKQNPYFTELSRRLGEQGLESFSPKGRRLKDRLHGEPVLFVSPDSEVFLLPAGSRNEEATLEESVVIKVLRSFGYGIRAIARMIGCAPATVVNELRRGTPPRKSERGRAPGYSPKHAQAVYKANRAA